MAGKRNYSRNSSRSNNGAFQKKHTGCRTGMDRNGNPYTSGWNYSKRFGLVSFLATPYKKTAVSTSKSGREWLNVMVKVTKQMAKPEIVSGMMDVRTGQVNIKDLGITMNPKAPNGGYCGKF